MTDFRKRAQAARLTLEDHRNADETGRPDLAAAALFSAVAFEMINIGYAKAELIDMIERHHATIHGRREQTHASTRAVQ